jgi:hypothetical protein
VDFATVWGWEDDYPVLQRALSVFDAALLRSSLHWRVFLPSTCVRGSLRPLSFNLPPLATGSLTEQRGEAAPEDISVPAHPGNSAPRDAAWAWVGPELHSLLQARAPLWQQQPARWPFDPFESLGLGTSADDAAPMQWLQAGRAATTAAKAVQALGSLA